MRTATALAVGLLFSSAYREELTTAAAWIALGVAVWLLGYAVTRGGR